MSPIVLFGSYAVVLFLAVYFFVFIPNNKKRKKMQAMHDALKPGDRIVTIGGVVGRIASRDAEYVTIIVDEEKDVRIKVILYAVSQVIT